MVAEELVRLKDEQLKTKDERLAVKDERIKVLEEQKANSNQASSFRQEARQIDLERIADRDKIITKQDAEIARLRNPGFFGTLFNPQFLKGGIAGYTACKIVSSIGGESGAIRLVTGQQSPVQNFSFSQAYPSSFYGQTESEKRLRQALKSLPK